jgi:hypothetical protein
MPADPLPADPLTADEQAALIAAMIELAEQGDHDGAAHLGELAQNPDDLRKVLAGDDAPGD